FDRSAGPDSTDAVFRSSPPRSASCLTMSGKAAHEISGLLETSTLKVAEIINSTKDRIGSANRMSQKCAVVFERITQRAGQVKTMVTSITDAASEQESGIQMVSRAMVDMRDLAGETDKMAHVIANLSDGLKGHAQSLAFTVHRLDGLVHGSDGGFERATVPPSAGRTFVEMSAEDFDTDRKRSA
ncbi:MAG: hypothetical protein HC902_05780, partial [Calothrix sp. SM1_5_4]|nr:hypothetical protein [Calothrix sp. SM1_5_4]